MLIKGQCPPELTFLFRDLSETDLLTDAALKVANKHIGKTCLDLLLHLPRDVTDRRYTPELPFAEEDKTATLLAAIEGHTPPPRRGLPYRITASAPNGVSFSIVYFKSYKDWLVKQFPVGQTRAISGRLQRYNDMWQMVHPDIVAPAERFEQIRQLEAVYSLPRSLSAEVFRRAIARLLKDLPAITEWQDKHLIKQKDWPSFAEALRTCHFHAEIAALSHPDWQKARERLAFEELCIHQAKLAARRQNRKKTRGHSFEGGERLTRVIRGELPFQLTGAQETALNEINADLSAPYRMTRLLQGDVGSGKTVVALLAAAKVIEAGYQTALMAPTEILARQHFQGLWPLCQKAGIRMALLTGRDSAAQRRSVKGGMASGSVDLAVGTHALFQQKVEFKNLGLVIVDEQHRFGVEQREKLAKKGQRPDMLMMSATPIPRTLAMTLYGDADVSRITEKPPGRQSVDTRIVSTERLYEVIEAIRRKLTAGEQVYWVCPLVEDSEVLDVTAAETRARELIAEFGTQHVALVHGQMPSEDKEAAMTRFTSGDAGLLVATTVIEVGVNVPNATVMVIEHAERFGLAQLHQLRGRVGRGDKPASCLLLYAPPLSETARTRLETLRSTDDGFMIAELDLDLRGSGDLLGTAQSGLPRFHIADLEQAEDRALLYTAHDAVKLSEKLL